MSRDGVEMLLDKWMSDERFRREMRSDPHGAVAGLGVVLDEEEQAAFGSVNWSLADEELEARVTKYGGSNGDC